MKPRGAAVAAGSVNEVGTQHRTGRKDPEGSGQNPALVFNIIQDGESARLESI